MTDTETRYQEALDYLYSHLDYSLQRIQRYSPEKFNLARMQALMESLDRPQDHYAIIHVAGTKGKGSTSALCASALRAAGYRTGFYSSPHLEDYIERIQVDGVPISHAELVDLVDEIKPKVSAIPELTTFDITTALAFLYFFRRGVKAAVIEVGLGGRLDSTNIVIPRVAVITSLSYDHTYVLGNTLAEIAGEKAGIIKPGVPIVLSPQKDEARLVVARIAKERSSPLIQVNHDFHFSALSHSFERQELLVWPKEEQALADTYFESGNDGDWEPVHLTIPLLGFHQVENAATAYTALHILNSTGFPIDLTAIQQGFREVVWHGRFEILRQDPPVIVDSAHNRDSALKLRQAVDDYFPAHPVVLVFGASEDKDIDGMFAELMPRIQQVVAVKSYHPRAMDPQLLVDLAHQYGKPARIIPDVADALDEALSLAGKEAVVLVAGSLFVAAGARMAWGKKKDLR